MSDGNFNRALLPSTPYRSGVRMGQQQTRIKALKILQEVLDDTTSSLTQEQKNQIYTHFEQKLKQLPL